MAEVFLSKSSEDILIGLSPSDQKEVARALSFLEDDTFRSQNRIDLILIEDGERIFALVVGIIWLAFYEGNEKSIKVVHLSMRSRFRPF